jgi:transcriptional regulator with XRE-family HTH domain
VKHAGEIVKSVVRDRGISISELARRLGRTRPFIYALFEKDSINTAVLQQLRQVLNYPFTELLGRQDPIKDYGGGFLSEAEFDSLQESLTRAEAEAEHWRKKYYELVEQFNAHLLKDKKKG